MEASNIIVVERGQQTQPTRTCGLAQVESLCDVYGSFLLSSDFIHCYRNVCTQSSPLVLVVIKLRATAR